MIIQVIKDQQAPYNIKKQKNFEEMIKSGSTELEALCGSYRCRVFNINHSDYIKYTDEVKNQIQEIDQPMIIKNSTIFSVVFKEKTVELTRQFSMVKLDYSRKIHFGEYQGDSIFKSKYASKTVLKATNPEFEKDIVDGEALCYTYGRYTSNPDGTSSINCTTKINIRPLTEQEKEVVKSSIDCHPSLTFVEFGEEEIQNGKLTTVTFNSVQGRETTYKVIYQLGYNFIGR